MVWRNLVIGELGVGGLEFRFFDFWVRVFFILLKYLGKLKVV